MTAIKTIKTGLLSDSFCLSCVKLISYLTRNHTITILIAKQDLQPYTTTVILFQFIFFKLQVAGTEDARCYNDVLLRSKNPLLFQIPFREPALKRHDVVTCIAPLFGNEQWQQALFAAHVYRKFGSHMHLYIRSMVSPVYELMRVYEKEGYLTIQPWLRLVLLTIPEQQFNPNVNVEFRNQAAAQTDCLLQYKESASYIAFVDLDDVLIPRLAGSYLGEFAHLFHYMPNVAYIHYMKENTKLEAVKSSSMFSLRGMLSSVSFEQKGETGKMVANPMYVNSTWIHFPAFITDGMERLEDRCVKFSLPKQLNSKSFSEQPLLSMRDIDDIQFDFERPVSCTATYIAGWLMNIGTRFGKPKLIYLFKDASCCHTRKHPIERRR
ncbi:unnamed protein product [Heligmosomoides polygyrus]|uniref:Glycosyltransferase family 92 protein n=1 Tax=Heligmosomoides polygyrus TaxID=6339 RepID=A0A3P8AZ67_HELPZ|nr:unnamed protein product [Heligmosomoides polygyrus]